MGEGFGGPPKDFWILFQKTQEGCSWSVFLVVCAGKDMSRSFAFHIYIIIWKSCRVHWTEEGLKVESQGNDPESAVKPELR